MIHTLNKAWATIIANQIKSGAIENALFVTSGTAEYIITEKLLDDLCNLKGCWIFDKNDVVVGVSGILNDKCFDDVLVSREANDPLLHNYLSKHCKRVMNHS